MFGTLEGIQVLTPVMCFSEGPNNISLLTDESRCQWYVVVNDKMLPCLGCQHGLDMFDVCMTMVRKGGRHPHVDPGASNAQ